MPLWVTILIAIVSTSAFTAIVNHVLDGFKNRKSKKSGVQAQLDRIEKNQADHGKRLERLEEHDKLQYQALLRLTVMNTEMPMSERLMAGQEYVDGGGNGDVRHYFENMKAEVDGK